MAKLGINTGSTPNDGTGDSLLSGAIKVNSNFDEIYSALGDGSSITNSIDFAVVAGYSTASGIATYATVAGVSTYATLLVWQPTLVLLPLQRMLLLLELPQRHNLLVV